MGLFDESDIYSYENIAMFEEPVPMDVLVELCRKGQVEIKDIFVSDITHQFLEYVASLDKKDYDNISSFIVFAGTLLEMKSSYLLPAEEDFFDEGSYYDDDGSEILPDDELLQFHACEYNILRDACDILHPMEILNRFYREPMFSEDDYNVVIKNFNLNKLITVFTLMMEKHEFAEDKPMPKTIVKERFTVSQRMREMVEIIRAYKVVKFTSLFEKDYSRVEKVNTFLALLELLKQRVATAVQEVPCGEITIKYSPSTDKFNAEEMTDDVESYN